MNRTLRKMSDEFRKQYVQNTFPAPNWIVDLLLAEHTVPLQVIIVLIYLIRKTIGWRNEHEFLTKEQICAETGVGHDHVIYAVRLICDCWGLFKRIPGRGKRPTEYIVNGPEAWTLEAFEQRRLYLDFVYDTNTPSPEQLEQTPCTPKIIALGKQQAEAEAMRFQTA